MPLELFKTEPNPQRFKAGEIIFREGDRGDQMYVIQSGEVDILLGKQHFATVGPGEPIGEMALINPGSPRSASVIAKTDCALVTIDQKRFTFLIQQNPFFAIDVMRILASRLARMDAQLSDQAFS